MLNKKFQTPTCTSFQLVCQYKLKAYLISQNDQRIKLYTAGNLITLSYPTYRKRCLYNLSYLCRIASLDDRGMGAQKMFCAP
jgi:hypothetical protein